ncbi:hypothetical protein [Oceanithermus profundus]
MKRLLAVPAVLAIAALFGLTGCNQQQGTVVTVKLLNQWGTPATATVIYQVGNGEWKLAARQDYGVYSFVVPPGETRYGVSANCIPSVLGLDTIGFFGTYQLTTNDATEVVFPCLNLSDQQMTEMTVTWDATALSGDRIRAFDALSRRSTSISPFTFSTLVGNQQPFLFLAYSTTSNFADLKGVVFERLDVTGANPSHSVTFAAGDAAVLGAVSGPATPAGFNDCNLDVYFQTSDGLLADDLGEASGNPCSGAYAKIPGTASGDVYVMTASYDHASDNRALVTMRFPEATGLGDVTLPALPSPWPAGYSVTAAALPTFTLDHPDGDAIGYMILYGGNGYFWTVYVSADWLAGATDYTLPDLSSAPDFGGIVPLSGEDMGWQVAALFSDHPMGDWLASQRWIGMGGPIMAPLIPGATLQAASDTGTFTVP